MLTSEGFSVDDQLQMSSCETAGCLQDKKWMKQKWQCNKTSHPSRTYISNAKESVQYLQQKDLSELNLQCGGGKGREKGEEKGRGVNFKSSEINGRKGARLLLLGREEIFKYFTFFFF